MVPEHLIEMTGLRTHFFTDDGVVKAVDGVDLTIRRGKTLCVVGESGCGKSVTAASILRLIQEPGRITAGSITYASSRHAEVDIASLDPKGRRIREIRGGEIGMIFQEPMSSLSAVHRIGEQIAENLRIHADLSGREAQARAVEMLDRVGIPNASERATAYPFELSGGMRQRAMIAMALSCDPQLLIADEPTTALDVTTQANILDLIAELQRDLGMSVMLITHDLGVVAEVADDVAVMYLGRVVEHGAVDQVFANPSHPYTKALMHSIPRLEIGKRTRLASIRGMVPHPLNRPTGCAFHPRCPSAVAGVCDTLVPREEQLRGGHGVRCHLYSRIAVNETPPRFDDGSAVLGQSVGARADERHEPEDASVVTDRDAAVARRDGRPLLSVRRLKTHFPVRRGVFQRVTGAVRAVDDVSFDIHEGETLGLVGESGCGKTTVGRSILRMYEPDDGQILYRSNGDEPADLAALTGRQLRSYRRHIRMIFQDPYTSLNPRLPVAEIVGEVLRTNQITPREQIEARVRDLLRRVGLRPEYVRRYPHAFSGGERQRIGIARALAPEPRLIVADEAVSALDVSVQAQTINLLKDLQAQFGLTFLFIAHDLSIVQHISDRVAVMYVGKLVELAPTDDLYAAPKHPYTEALLSAVPRTDPSLRNQKARIRLAGEVADAANPPTGCYFHPRCRYATDLCRTTSPELREVAPGHHAACHHAERLSLRGVADLDRKQTNAEEAQA